MRTLGTLTRKNYYVQKSLQSLEGMCTIAKVSWCEKEPYAYVSASPVVITAFVKSPEKKTKLGTFRSRDARDSTRKIQFW